jgi:glutathione synthase/RimK-type ligase-like ATP-grasp enzyme
MLILTDYKDNFWVSCADLKSYMSIDTNKLKAMFEQSDFKTEIKRFSEVNFNEDYRGVYVIYQSSEDCGTFYKDYIEDVLLYLDSVGAVLVPKFQYFRAHHNKCYMELLRYSFSDPSLKTIRSRVYGVGKDAISETRDFPVVVKAAEGAGSRYVMSANDGDELKKVIKKLANVYIVNGFKTVKEFLIYYICGRFFGKVQSQYRDYPFARKKFLVQNMIVNLEGDYKVLYYGGKYYTLYRKNRENDFRASGGGRLLDVPDDENEGILNFAKRVVEQIDAPIIGIDIANDGSKFHLIEFQMIHQGPYTLHRAEGWYEYINNDWVYFRGKSELETEVARSIVEYIDNTTNVRSTNNE